MGESNNTFASETTCADNGFFADENMLGIMENEDLSNEDLDALSDAIDNLILQNETETDEQNITNKDLKTLADSFDTNDSVRMYLMEIGQINLLSFEEEIALGRIIVLGKEANAKMEELAGGEEPIPSDMQTELDALIKSGEKARDQLTKANLRLVVSVAKKFTGRGLPLLDLIQEGSFGLMRAVERFDYTKGYRFSTYATWWIRQTISRAIADHSRIIRLPVHMTETLNKLTRTRHHLVQELGRSPTVKETAAALQVSEDRIRYLMTVSQDPVSLEAPVGEEADSFLGDFVVDEDSISPADAAIASTAKDVIMTVLASLPQREQKVLKLRYGLEDGRTRTLEEVGKEFNVTRERIRQIEAKAIERLKRGSRGKQLKDFWI